MSDIPSDVFRKILLRLPAESLFRLRSVCKEWLRIIDDPTFIKAHTNNQLHSHTLLVRNQTGDPLFLFSLDSLNFVRDLQKIDGIRIKQLIRQGVPRLPALFYVASCNGLILISHADIKKIWAIWNPLTGDCHELPRPKFELGLNVLGLGFGFGFGYDRDADDYKVVRVDSLIPATGKRVLQTLVYSLKSDSWRVIEDCPGFVGYDPGVFLNDTLYWRSHDSIIALDVRTESYSKLPLPPVINTTRNSSIVYHLDALDGFLIFSLNYYIQALFDGWVMKDDGAEKSWIKLFSVRLSLFHYIVESAHYIVESARSYRLVAYLKGKEQIVLQYCKGFLWFDIGNNSVLYFSVHGFSSIDSSKICPGSLVRFKSHGSTVGFDTTATTSTSTKKRKTSCEKTDSSLKICVRADGDLCCSSENEI